MASEYSDPARPEVTSLSHLSENDSPSGSCPSVPGRLWGVGGAGLMENAGVALDPQSRALSSEKIN